MRVRATDVYGEPLAIAHTITVQRLGSGSKHRKVADVPARGTGTFETAVTHDYRVRIVADGHAGAAVQVPGTKQEVTVPVPVLPAAVIGYRWPDPEPEIPGVDQAVLEDGHRGALLNIWAKLWDVMIDMAPAASYVDEVLEVREDRIIARVADELPELLEDQEHLDVVSSGLHEPPAGYVNGISVKSKDKRGNIQITTFVPEDASAGNAVLADVDVDENRDLFPHLWDVAAHHVTGRKTDHVEIHEILVYAGVDPGWKPLVA